MHISYSAKAVADLENIQSYISENDEAEIAIRIVQRILQALSILENFPNLGRAGRVEETREFKINGLPYYAVYHFSSDTEITIITVMHERRQYPTI